MCGEGMPGGTAAVRFFYNFYNCSYSTGTETGLENSLGRLGEADPDGRVSKPDWRTSRP